MDYWLLVFLPSSIDKIFFLVPPSSLRFLPSTNLGVAIEFWFSLFLHFLGKQNKQETEKQALKSALVEERSRYCLFVACLKPVMVRTMSIRLNKSIGNKVDIVFFFPFMYKQQSEEMSMMAELSHLEEIITQLDKHTADPFSLPSSTEQVKQQQYFSKFKWNWMKNLIIVLCDIVRWFPSWRARRTTITGLYKRLPAVPVH